MMSQEHITSETPMGATLLPDGATFRAWAPRARQVYVNGDGQDVVIAGSLREQTWHGYRIGFPRAGHWREVFNTDAYDNWVNPIVAGNGGAIEAVPTPMHGFVASAEIVIPANGVVIFKVGDN
jgi:1,4-alpha-glucan branching enzyme